MTTIDFLRRLPLFASLSKQDLDWLAGMSETVSIPAGEWLMQEGSAGGALYVVMEGEFEVTKRSGQQDVVIAVRGPGEVFGEMSLLDQAPRSASARALQNSRLLKISQDAFRELLASRPAATLTILRTVTSRLRNTESMLRQNEKMAALGTLSAGLAHELNNPAAAARRSTAQLRDAFAEWQRLSAELAMLGHDANQVQAISALHEDIARRAATPLQLDPLARSDRESELQSWLEERGIAQAWEIVSPLVSLGWDPNAFEKLGRDFSGTRLSILARWLGIGFSIYTLLDEVGKSAEQISAIVKAVKSYAYLDQAPIQDVDVREGLENTLVILRHKIGNGVHIVRDYADSPRLEGYASELNQVWTNIIDNAIDAMQGKGELVLRTYRQDEQVVVEITDSGPGIPPEIQSRVFEPFFTTKPPGVGTGLGLHISYNIVQRHHGQIRVSSKPGATTFRVELPIRLIRG